MGEWRGKERGGRGDGRIGVEVGSGRADGAQDEAPGTRESAVVRGGRERRVRSRCAAR